jgi:predicted SprT family Zn-dependent metalloprotease
MNLLIAQNIAKNLIVEHGLSALGWRFNYDRSKRRLGCCKFSKRLITLSPYYTANSEEDTVRNTILHEIAHALVGPRNNHNNVWRCKAREIGCLARRTGSPDDRTAMPQGRYKWNCTGCGLTGSYHRRPKHLHVPNAYRCPRCRAVIQWS